MINNPSISIDGVRLVNLTPHAINLVLDSGDQIRIPSSGTCRCDRISKIVRKIGSIPVERVFMGEPIGLPDPVPNTYYIVSLQVAMSAHRSDVLTVTSTVKNEYGRVVGARALSTVV